MLTRAIEHALQKHHQWTQWDTFFTTPPQDMDELMKQLPEALQKVDTFLWEGMLFATMKQLDIAFHTSTSNRGPAGMTTYDSLKGMRLVLNKNAWVKAFPAMVGGTLCSSAGTCLAKIIAHEMIHMLLFTIYMELNLSLEDIHSIPTKLDTHHNVLFCRWLKDFFFFFTIDNSLLIHQLHGPLTFQKSVPQIEQQCLQRQSSSKNELYVLHKGEWKPASFVKKAKSHHSIISLASNHQRLVVPNGLITC